MEMLLNLFRKKEITDLVTRMDRIKNIATKNFRGILGTIVPIVMMFIVLEENKHENSTLWIWLWMCWAFLIQPVNVPVIGLIPVFAFPLTGAMPTEDVCSCYFNENITLFLLGGWLQLLWNNSGFERRLSLNIMCGPSCTSSQLLVRSSIAAFILSMFSDTRIATANIIQYVDNILSSLKTTDDNGEDKYTQDLDKFLLDKLRRVIINAIHTSSAIGSIVIPHASYAILAFRTVFYGSQTIKTQFSDVFNYLQYTAFAFPTAMTMFILNLIYGLKMLGPKLSEPSKTILKTALNKHKRALPKKMSSHEILTIIAAFLTLVMHYTRWSPYFNGWGGDAKMIYPGVKDATVSAIFVVVLCILPCSFGFTKYLGAKTQSQLPPHRTESAILWWKYVDRNTLYGYIFLIGSGVCLSRGIAYTHLDILIKESSVGKMFTDQDHNVMMMMLVFVIVFLANIMSGVPALCVFLPFVMHMVDPKSPHYDKRHYGALGVGIGASLGFMCPSSQTPAYFAHHHPGQIPKLKMAISALPSVVICAVVLWLALCFYANVVIDSKLLADISSIVANLNETTVDNNKNTIRTYKNLGV